MMKNIISGLIFIIGPDLDLRKNAMSADYDEVFYGVKGLQELSPLKSLDLALVACTTCGGGV